MYNGFVRLRGSVILYVGVTFALGAMAAVFGAAGAGLMFYTADSLAYEFSDWDDGDGDRQLQAAGPQPEAGLLPTNTLANSSGISDPRVYNTTMDPYWGRITFLVLAPRFIAVCFGPAWLVLRAAGATIRCFKGTGSPFAPLWQLFAA